MDYDLASFVQQQDPAARQQMMAEVLRSRSRSAALQGANEQAHQFDPLAAVAPLLNNPGAVAAANVASKNASAQYKPLQMGNQGFALPTTGEFVASPIYEQEQDERRQVRRDIADQNNETRRYTLSQSLEAQANRAAEAEQGRRERAQQANETRQTIAAQGNALRQTLATMHAISAGQRTTDREAAAAEKADAKKSSDLDKNVVKYSQTLEKAGIPEFDSALATAEGRLSMYEKGKLPGYGRLESQIPDWAAGTEMQQTRADMQGAANVLLKARSGAAVTDSEALRFLREVSTGKGMDEESMRHGWENVRKNFDAKRGAVSAGFGPDVHDEFISRGGKDYRFNMNAPRPGTDAPPAGVDAALWGVMTPKEKALWQKK